MSGLIALIITYPLGMIYVKFKEEMDDEVTLSEEIPLKNRVKPYLYSMIICISQIYSGYCLTMISASNLHMLQQYYSIRLSLASTLSLLNGTLPAGGMLGSILVPYFISFSTKK